MDGLYRIRAVQRVIHEAIRGVKDTWSTSERNQCSLETMYSRRMGSALHSGSGTRQKSRAPSAHRCKTGSRAARGGEETPLGQAEPARQPHPGDRQAGQRQPQRHAPAPADVLAPDGGVAEEDPQLAQHQQRHRRGAGELGPGGLLAHRLHLEEFLEIHRASVAGGHAAISHPQLAAARAHRDAPEGRRADQEEALGGPHRAPAAAAGPDAEGAASQQDRAIDRAAHVAGAGPPKRRGAGRRAGARSALFFSVLSRASDPRQMNRDASSRLLPASRPLILPFTPGLALRFVLAVWAAALLFTARHQREVLRDPAQLGNQLSFLTITGLLVYTMGNYEVTLRSWRDYLLFLPVLVASMLIFYWCGQQGSLRNNLSSSEDWDETATYIYGCTLGAVFLVLLLHAVYTYRHQPQLFKVYMTAMMLPPAIVGLLYLYSSLVRGVLVVHVHHWWLSFYVSFFTRYRWWVSRVAAPIFLGVAVEGIMEAGQLALFIIDRSGP